METDVDLAKASALALSSSYGPNLVTAVERIAAGQIPRPAERAASRDFKSTVATTASIVQIGWFVFEVSRVCWNAFKSSRDKKAAEAAAQDVRPPIGLTGEQREKIIKAISDALQ